MSDTPERIWAKDKSDHWGTVGDWYSHGKGGGTPYVRADLYDALKAENERLRKEAAEAYEKGRADATEERAAYDAIEEAGQDY